VLCDVDPGTYLLDTDDALTRVTDKTRAIVAVDLYGQAAPLEALSNIDGVAPVEDAAQAQGAQRHGMAAGRLGIAASTSFYPGKNLGAYGDGGAVVTDNDDIAAVIRALRNHGSEIRYEHPRLGVNSRLDSIQAAVLLVKLRHLADWNAARRAAAACYDALLADIDGVTLPETLAGNEHVWHLYVVRVPERDRVLSALEAEGIGAAIHYPSPVHLHGAFHDLGYRAGDFPVAEAATAEILSLPLFPEITSAQQERVVDVLKRALRTSARPA
jgi:dTDP-4-amino-4,6-dideoxygalactose transaminase